MRFVRASPDRPRVVPDKFQKESNGTWACCGCDFMQLQNYYINVCRTSHTRIINGFGVARLCVHAEQLFL